MNTLIQQLMSWLGYELVDQEYMESLPGRAGAGARFKMGIRKVWVKCQK